MKRGSGKATLDCGVKVKAVAVKLNRKTGRIFWLLPYLFTCYAKRFCQFTSRY